MRLPSTPAAVTLNRDQSPLATLKPANSIVPSDGIGRQALSATMSTKTPARPRSSITFTANCTSGSVNDATSNVAPGYSGGLDARERQGADALLGPLGRPPDVGLRPQH